MKKIILLLAFAASITALKAQDSLYANSQALIGYSVGVNFSKFHFEHVTNGTDFPFKDIRGGSMPTLGMFQVVKLNNTVALKFNESYSPKKSFIMHPYRKIYGHFIDISILPQARLTDEVAFQSGLVFNALANDFTYSELNVLAGVQIRLQKRINLDVTYQVPLASNYTSNLNISLNYIINKRKNKEPKVRRIEKRERKSQVSQLNDGILLVRLKDWEQKIDAHKTVGNDATSKDLHAYRRAQNLAIVKAFKENYHFSKVAFFMSENSSNVKDANFDGIFLNDSLVKDPGIKVDKSQNWFIGEVDFLEMDTAKHWQSSHYNIYTKKYEKIYYSNSPNFSRCAIVIRDKNFIQLRKPFPYFTSCQTEIKNDPMVVPVNDILKRTYGEAVKKLNTNLTYKYLDFFMKPPKNY